MIELMFNSLLIEHSSFENILCNGDRDDSSLISFQSSIDLNKIIIKDVSINYCRSNGDLIKISGGRTYIEIENVLINSITSYGSLINNFSMKVLYIYFIYYTILYYIISTSYYY